MAGRTMPKKTMLLCGATGFIGRNLLEHFKDSREYKLRAVIHKKPAPRPKPAGVEFVKADLTKAADVARVLRGVDVVVQAAATTSGSKDILSKPYYHVTDNAVMNSLLLRACHEQGVGRFLFFSCTVMYASSKQPVREEDFSHSISDKYYGVGWTKVYIEKMCEFYARLGRTKTLAIRHSNIYGPHDKYDLERSHVFGATIAKVMTAKTDKISIWGDGSEARDLLYVSDLVSFVEAALARQSAPFDVVNVGSGEAVSVADLVKKIIDASGKKLGLEFDRTKPSILFSLSVATQRARSFYGWQPSISLEEGIKKSLAWYRENV